MQMMFLRFVLMKLVETPGTTQHMRWWIVASFQIIACLALLLRSTKEVRDLKARPQPQERNRFQDFPLNGGMDMLTPVLRCVSFPLTIPLL